MFLTPKTNIPEIDNRNTIRFNFGIQKTHIQSNQFLAYQATAQQSCQIERIHRIHSSIQSSLEELPPFFRQTAEKAGIAEEMCANSRLAGNPLPRPMEALENSQSCQQKERAFGHPYRKLLSHKTPDTSSFEGLTKIHSYFEPLLVQPRYYPALMDKLDMPFLHMFQGNRANAASLIDDIICGSVHKISDLSQIAIRHFLLSYMQPFPKGNEILARYVTSCYLYHQFHDFTFLPLSSVLEQYADDYKCAYQTAYQEEDMTEFVHLFLFCLERALYNCSQQIEKEKLIYQRHLPLLENIIPAKPAGPRKLANLLLISSLFEGHGISSEDAQQLLSMDRRTISNHIKAFPQGLITKYDVSRPSRCSILPRSLANFSES